MSLTRTSSPSSATSTRSGYITSNSPSGSSAGLTPPPTTNDDDESFAKFPFNEIPSRFEPATFAFPAGALTARPRSYLRRNGSERSTVVHGSQLGGSTKPRLRSRQTFSSLSRALIISHTRTPRPVAAMIDSITSMALDVGCTSASPIPSSGIPATTYDGGRIPSHAAESGEEPGEEPAGVASSFARSATQGPSQWHLRVSTAHITSSSSSSSSSSRSLHLSRCGRSPDRTPSCAPSFSPGCGDAGTDRRSAASEIHHPRR